MAEYVEKVTLWANLLTAFFTAIAGISAVAGVLAYRDAKEKDARDRADSAYSRANERYNEYIRLCLEHPSADAFDVLRSELSGSKVPDPQIPSTLAPSAQVPAKRVSSSPVSGSQLTALSVTQASSDDEYQRLIIFAVLISAMEAAFIQYDQTEPRARALQWDEGWAAYIDAWLDDPRFLKSWELLGVQYDKRFVAYMNKRRGELAVRGLKAP